MWKQKVSPRRPKALLIISDVRIIYIYITGTFKKAFFGTQNTHCDYIHNIHTNTTFTLCIYIFHIENIRYVPTGGPLYPFRRSPLWNFIAFEAMFFPLRTRGYRAWLLGFIVFLFAFVCIYILKKTSLSYKYYLWIINTNEKTNEKLMFRFSVYFYKLRII